MFTSKMRPLVRSSVAVVAAGILVLAPGTAGAAGVLRPAVALQTAPDALSPYRPQTTCDPVVKPGLRALRDMVMGYYGIGRDGGITRACNVSARQRAPGGTRLGLDARRQEREPARGGRRLRPVADRAGRLRPGRRERPPARRHVRHLEPPDLVGVRRRLRLAALQRCQPPHRPRPREPELGRRLPAHVVVDRCRRRAARRRPVHGLRRRVRAGLQRPALRRVPAAVPRR